MIESDLDGLLDLMLSRLTEPMSLDQMAEGWTAESKDAARSFFLGLKRDLQSNKPLPPLSISRALDHWGVTSGESLELATEISNRLRSHRKFGVDRG